MSLESFKEQSLSLPSSKPPEHHTSFFLLDGTSLCLKGFDHSEAFLLRGTRQDLVFPKAYLKREDCMAHSYGEVLVLPKERQRTEGHLAIAVFDEKVKEYLFFDVPVGAVAQSALVLFNETKELLGNGTFAVTAKGHQTAVSKLLEMGTNIGKILQLEEEAKTIFHLEPQHRLVLERVRIEITTFVDSASFY